MTFAGQSLTVVGVMPPVLLPAELIGEGRFRFADHDERIYVPFADVPAKHGHVFGVLGRLKRGVSLDEARAELQVVGTRLQQSFPDTHAGYQARALALTDELLGSARQALGALLLSALLLLVVACTNVAHFQLARVLERESGSAVRAALGASRWQVARPFVLEGLLLAVAGGILGAALAYGALRSAVALLPAELPRVGSAEVDPRSLGIALALSLLAGAAVGLLAGSRASRPDLTAGLRSGSRLKGSASPRLRQLLLVGQAALAVVLVALAGLLAETLSRLSSVETGFEKGELLVVELRHGMDRYKERQQLVAFYDELERRAAALPGVAAVGASYDAPLQSNWYQSFDVVGAPEAPPGKGPGGLFRTVTPGYFKAAGVKLEEGRPFTDADDAGKRWCRDREPRPRARLLRKRLAPRPTDLADDDPVDLGRSDPARIHDRGRRRRRADPRPGRLPRADLLPLVPPDAPAPDEPAPARERRCRFSPCRLSRASSTTSTRRSPSPPRRRSAPSSPKSSPARGSTPCSPQPSASPP